MSENTVSFNNGQQLQVNTNLAKLFPFEKEMLSYQLTNSTYGTVTYQAGTVMGVVGSTGEIVPVDSAATNGSQTPVGVLAQDYTLDAGESKNVYIAVRGWVRKDMLIFKVGQTINSIVSNRRFFELLLAAGLFIQTTESCTNYENQYS
jgi:hypothetical protein